MANFATFIADPDLESKVIKAIAQVKGQLLHRSVSLEQLGQIGTEENCILITGREVTFHGPHIVVDKSISIEELIAKLEPSKPVDNFNFQKKGGEVICFLGASGGVGTTTLAINYAFEKALKTKVLLLDLDQRNPDIAIALGLHRIEGRVEHISKSLAILQGATNSIASDLYICDLGSNLSHPMLKFADRIILVSRIGFNTLPRLKSLTINPNVIILNFYERSKFQLNAKAAIELEFPRSEILPIPLEIKSFEFAAMRKSALVEVAASSRARKSLATLG